MKKILSVFIVLAILSGCDVNSTPPAKEEKPKVETNSPLPSEMPTDKEEEKPEPSVSPSEKPEEKQPEKVVEEVGGLSNALNGWGYRKISGARPEFTSGQVALMDKYNCIYMGSPDEKKVYLTFDEGYENGYTAEILDTLKAEGVKAAFFITGPYFDKNTDLVDRMVAEGHIVGNHTVNHPSLPSVSDEKFEAELLDLDKKFYARYGKAMKYLRPPMGEYSERTLSLSNKLGYTNAFWSFAYRDWETDNQKGTDYAYEQVMDGIHNGIVILLHAVSVDNTRALGDIIRDARAKGFVFATLDEYTR